MQKLIKFILGEKSWHCLNVDNQNQEVKKEEHIIHLA